MNRGSSIRVDLDLRESLQQRLRPEALVLQEDRNLVMGPPGVLDRDADADIDEAARIAARHCPVSLGRFLLGRDPGGGAEWIYRAVVHDFDSRPTCRPGDVRRSVTAILADADRRGITTLAIEPIGVWNRHGLALDAMVEALDESLLEASISTTTNIRMVLMLDRMDQLEEVSHLLRSLVLRRASRSFRTVNGDAALVEVHREGHRLRFRFVPGTMSGYMVTRLGSAAGDSSRGAPSCLDIS